MMAPENAGDKHPVKNGCDAVSDSSSSRVSSPEEMLGEGAFKAPAAPASHDKPVAL